jgi:hypothetical protein
MAWTPNLTMTNLGNLYRWVERVATDAIAWYMNEKEEKPTLVVPAMCCGADPEPCLVG